MVALFEDLGSFELFVAAEIETSGGFLRVGLLGIGGSGTVGRGARLIAYQIVWLYIILVVRGRYHVFFLLDCSYCL